MLVFNCNQENFMNKIIYILMFVFLAGCERPPISEAPTNNPAIIISKLFQYDGCTVYRFNDNREAHYFTNCKGSVSSEQSCGRNCRYDETIETK